MVILLCRKHTLLELLPAASLHTVIKCMQGEEFLHITSNCYIHWECFHILSLIE